MTDPDITLSAARERVREMLERHGQDSGCPGCQAVASRSASRVAVWQEHGAIRTIGRSVLEALVREED